MFLSTCTSKDICMLYSWFAFERNHLCLIFNINCDPDIEFNGSNAEFYCEGSCRCVSCQKIKILFLVPSALSMSLGLWPWAVLKTVGTVSLHSGVDGCMTLLVVN